MTVISSAESLIVITGANGLVGSHVCTKLVEAGASVRAADDPAEGPFEGGCTAINVVGRQYATVRDYHETVCEAVGVEPVWQDEPVWTGAYLADRLS